jgi:transposase-like protein
MIIVEIRGTNDTARFRDLDLNTGEKSIKKSSKPQVKIEYCIRGDFWTETLIAAMPFSTFASEPAGWESAHRVAVNRKINANHTLLSSESGHFQNISIKAMIVIEGLKGKPVAELCTKHQISQAQYYQWRDQFLAHAPKAFEVHEQSQRAARLAREHARLKTLVGELTLELKKSDEVLG